MLKIIKNDGKLIPLEHKYIFYTEDFKDIGPMFAPIGIKPVIGYVKAKMKLITWIVVED